MRDREATAPWLIHLVNASTIGPMHFHPAGVAYIPEGLPGDIVSTEQSNTSLVYGQEAILKLFRRLEPGLNPDVEIHAALRQTDNAHIAPLLGHIEIDDADPATPPATVAMLQTSCPTRATAGGWPRPACATSTPRATCTPTRWAATSPPTASGSARRPPRCTPTSPPCCRPSRPARTGTRRRGRQMGERLDGAIEVVPQLAEHADGLRALYAAVDRTAGSPSSASGCTATCTWARCCGRRTGWIVLDFEGEPARLAGRPPELDSPLRDVAGMLRSFDYAARHMLVEQPDDPQRAYRAQEWAARNRTAFCTGYSEAQRLDPCGESPLLRAFEADKAVYECVYEARNRPHWLMIPLNSLARISQD